MSCWLRLRDRQQASVWSQLHQVLLGRRHAAGQVHWHRPSVDTASGVDPISSDRRRVGLGTESDELSRGAELQA